MCSAGPPVEHGCDCLSGRAVPIAHATGDQGALRLAAAEPVVAGPDIDTDELSASLCGAGCVESAGSPFAEGWLRIRRTGGCG